MDSVFRGIRIMVRRRRRAPWGSGVGFKREIAKGFLRFGYGMHFYSGYGYVVVGAGLGTSPYGYSYSLD